MSTAKEKKRLPNELLWEIANTMPAGIIDQENGDFMARMEPLSAFIQPIFNKFNSKAGEYLYKMQLKHDAINLKFEELRQIRDNLQEILPDDDQVNLAEAYRQRVALIQQCEELFKEQEECRRECVATNSAWDRSFDFVEELLGDNKAANEENGQHSSSSINDGGTVCEASRKRKNSTSVNDDEEESAEEGTNSKKARVD